MQACLGSYEAMLPKQRKITKRQYCVARAALYGINKPGTPLKQVGERGAQGMLSPFEKHLHIQVKSILLSGSTLSLWSHLSRLPHTPRSTRSIMPKLWCCPDSPHLACPPSPPPSPAPLYSLIIQNSALEALLLKALPDPSPVQHFPFCILNILLSLHQITLYNNYFFICSFVPYYFREGKKGKVMISSQHIFLLPLLPVIYSREKKSATILQAMIHHMNSNYISNAYE